MAFVVDDDDDDDASLLINQLITTTHCTVFSAYMQCTTSFCYEWACTSTM